MKLKIRRQPDFYSGLLFIAIGAACSVQATRYTMGTAAHMGPGYFPFLLGLLLALLGGFVTISSLASTGPGETVDAIAIRPLVLVLAAVAAFAVLLEPAGFLISAAALVLICSFADRDFRLKTTLVVSVVLIGACYLIFIYGLGLPMTLWPGGR